MKVTYSGHPIKRMGEVMSGQAFIRRYEDHSYSIYLRIDCFEDRNRHSYNCVDLDDGCLEYIENDVTVEVLDAEILIK